MAWMAAEAAVAITAGILASSIALTGFGLDSVIEFFSAAIVIWEQGRVAGTVQPAGNIAASMIANAGSIGGPEFSCIYRRIRIIVLLNMWHCDEAEPNNSFISMPASPFFQLFTGIIHAILGTSPGHLGFSYGTVLARNAVRSRHVNFLLRHVRG
jgi:hypothetical protein